MEISNMLFIMRATSCSGKDRFIDIHFHNRNHVLSSDDFREILLGDRASQQQNTVVFDTIHSILETRFINRVSWTVLNATNLRIKDCNKTIELCKKYGIPFTVISIQPPTVEELILRNQKRASQGGLDIPDNVFSRHVERYYNNLSNFHLEANNNPLCKFIEIDQDYKVKDEIL